MADITRRYSNSEVLIDSDGHHYLGTLHFPDFQIKDTDTRHIVTSGDVGRLDLISQRYYNTPNLWWVIARTNNIKIPEDDMHTGQYIIIPDYQRVIDILKNQ